MSTTTPTRWKDEAMHARVRRRYTAERWFRSIGFAAVAISVLFPCLLARFHGRERESADFTRYEAALPIDFTKSDLFLDPATLRGPDAEQAVQSADLESAISQAAIATYGKGAAEMFGDAASNTLAKDIVANNSYHWCNLMASGRKQGRHCRQA